MAAASTYDTNLERVWNEIRDLGLEPYVAELDAKGYTVIPPEIANPNGPVRAHARSGARHR